MSTKSAEHAQNLARHFLEECGADLHEYLGLPAEVSDARRRVALAPFAPVLAAMITASMNYYADDIKKVAEPKPRPRNVQPPGDGVKNMESSE